MKIEGNVTRSLGSRRHAIVDHAPRKAQGTSKSAARSSQAGLIERDRAEENAISAAQKFVPPFDESQQRGGIQSIGRAFLLLEEIAFARDGIALSELSKRVGLHNSTTFHILKTMVSLGYVRQIRDTKRYRIGRPLFALAAGALDEIEMVSCATPILEDLSQETGESCHFSVRSGDAVMVMARTSGPSAFQLTNRVGILRPAHCTALGKVILAALSPEQFERFLKRADLRAHSPKSMTEPDLLRREIADVRRTGIAFDDGEFDNEVRCVAVPVLDFSGQTLGAIGISGPIWRMSIQTLQSHAGIVRRAASQLSAAFGFTGRDVRHIEAETDSNN
jgi:DNA-binding IclR family transcriptional regulator